MKAIILAAGRGRRMKNLTDERPKCLVELRGKSLIDWQLDALRGAKVSEIAIVTGYMSELLSNRGLIEFHNPRWAETQMVTSLTFAATWLQNEPCIVSYSDIFFNSEAVESLMKVDSALAITYDYNWLDHWTKRFDDPLEDAETFRLSNSETLLEIGQKPNSVKEIEGQYMGLLRFEPKGWSEVMRIYDGLTFQEKDMCHMTGMLQKIIEAKRIPVQCVPYGGDWGEVDSESDLRAYDF